MALLLSITRIPHLPGTWSLGPPRMYRVSHSCCFQSVDEAVYFIKRDSTASTDTHTSELFLFEQDVKRASGDVEKGAGFSSTEEIFVCHLFP
mgnify:CR=1 FL=1